jgi:hypothetical protein
MKVMYITIQFFFTDTNLNLHLPKPTEDFWCLDVMRACEETQGGSSDPSGGILHLANEGKKLQVKEEVEVTEVQWVDAHQSTSVITV